MFNKYYNRNVGEVVEAKEYTREQYEFITGTDRRDSLTDANTAGYMFYTLQGRTGWYPQFDFLEFHVRM